MMKQNERPIYKISDFALIGLKGEIISGGVSHNKRYGQA